MTVPPVRPAIPDDAGRLRAIQTVALAEPWPELLELGLDGPPLCLVYVDPDPTGYVLAVVDEGDAEAYLAELAVARGHRGQGQGSALLSALVERVRERGVTRLRVTARADDERVRSFYEDNGFTFEAALPDHYDAGDGVLLHREL